MVHGHRERHRHRLAGHRLVRGAGHEVRRRRQYNEWVTHKITFDSPLVKQAGEEFEKLVLTEGNHIGDGKTIASTGFGDAENSMWKSDPGCWLFKQGSFITAFFPEDVVKNFATDVGVFGFPPANAGEKAPVLGGGDLAVLLNDNDAAKTGMKMLAETDIGNDGRGQRLVVPVAAQGLRLVPLHQPGHQGRRPGGQERLRPSSSTAPTRCRAKWVRAPSGSR